MAIGGVVINFAAKTADAVRDVAKLDKTLGRLQKGAEKSGSKIGKFAGSLSNSLPVVGAVAGAAVGLGIAFVEAGKAALEDKQQADKLAHTLKTIPGVTQAAIDKNEEWISSMELATLVSDTELRAAISKLTLATGDLGEAQKLAALATDVAAGSGKSYSAVVTALAKAVDGNTASLGRMFPWLDKDKDGTLTLKEATEGLGKAFTGASEAAARNDPWKRIAVIFDQLKEAVGGALLPVLQKLGDWFASAKNRAAVTKFINKVAELADSVGRDLVVQLQKLAAWLQDPANQQMLMDWAQGMGDLANAIGGVIDKVISLKSWIDKLPSNWVLRKIGLLPDTSAAAAAPAGLSVVPSAAPVTVNVFASGPDIPNSPRAVRALLDSHDLRMGRRPGQPRAVAW
jgi:hypothetical protein